MSAPSPEPLLQTVGVRKHFPLHEGLLSRNSGSVKAVDGVDLVLRRGEVLGVVGESGSGKSTLGRLVLRLIEPSDGRVIFDGADIAHQSMRSLRPLRRRMQMVFQDPYSSLNPRMTVGAAIAEALRTHGLANGAAVTEQIAGLLRQVGLQPDHMRRYPRAFSGGQRQRVAIARALAVQPELLVADEPVSALDVSIQAEIVNLLTRLRNEFQLSMMFISHDLSVVEILADRILVLYLGHTMETGPAAQVFAAPRHPYTRALLSAVPGRDRELGRRPFTIEGETPSPIAPPPGCVFSTRCPFALPECTRAVPTLRTVAPGQETACIRDDLDLT